MRQEQGTADLPRSEPLRGKESPKLTRIHRALISVIVGGAVVIAGIGFAGSYAAVRALAVRKGFGEFAYVFPIGVDAGIVVLLALDLLLTWMRMRFPLLRHTAWLLTAATIAFNGAAAWPDPLGVGMHAVIPVLFVVAVEAARHAIGRAADITADKHMEGVRFWRWLLAPAPTFLLWRRMKLWELRSYDQTIKLEQDRLVYQARLRSRFGRSWRRKAPVESLMPLRLARYGVPLAETAPAGLAAAGIPLPAELERLDIRPELPAGAQQQQEPEPVDVDVAEHHRQYETPVLEAASHPESEPTPATVPQYETYEPQSQRYDQFQDYSQLAGAGSPAAARRDGRPPMVQARVDSPDWFQNAPAPVADEVPSPIGDEPEPQLEPHPEPAVNEVTSTELEPELSGVDLLEYRYLQLSPQERAQSASALARLLHPGTGFTEGTARKYLKPIIERHG